MLNYDPIYLEALPLILKFEGIDTDDPDDQGGQTIFGIASKYFPNEYQEVYNLYHNGNKQEAYEKVKEFYYKKFWIRSAANKVYNKELGIFLFDTAVNMGVRTAVKLLQRTFLLLSQKIPYLRAKLNFSLLATSSNLPF